LSNHPHNVAPQLEVVRKVPVLVAEELDFLDAEHASRGALLFLPDRSKLRVLLLWILAALRSVGDDDVRHLGPVHGQLGDRSARGKLRIVGVSRHHENTIELRSFGLRLSRSLALCPGCDLLRCHGIEEYVMKAT